MCRPACRDMRTDKHTFMLSNAQCFGCTPKFQKKLVQNQAAQTSQRLTGIQNKPFRCKNFDYVYIVLLSITNLLLLLMIVIALRF